MSLILKFLQHKALKDKTKNFVFKELYTSLNVI